MSHFTKIYDGVDVAPLLAQLDQYPDLWGTYRHRKMPGSPHARMSDIWVRYNRLDRFDEANPAAFNAEHIPVWYPAWRVLTALHPILFDLAGAVQCEMIGGVLITRIPPGERIDSHTDQGWHVDQYEKFYLSPKSAPGADFICEHDGVEERFNPKPGEWVLFDNRKRHRVENNSPEDRITVIACLRTAMFGRPT